MRSGRGLRVPIPGVSRIGSRVVVAGFVLLLASLMTLGATGPVLSSTPDAGVGQITFELGSGARSIADTPENAGVYPPPPPGYSIWMQTPGVDLRTPSEDGYGNLSGFYYAAGPVGKRHDLYAEMEFDQTTRITRNAGDNLFPRYTSQTAVGHLVFQSNRTGNWDVWRMTVQREPGSWHISTVVDPVNLTRNGATDGRPDPLPGTATFAFDSNRSGNYEIYTMNLDRSKLVRVTKNPSADEWPSYQWVINLAHEHVGRRIAWMSNRTGNWDIFVRDMKTSRTANLTNAPGYDGEPAWSPDGNWIAFLSARSGSPQIWVMKADGTGLVQVTQATTSVSAPYWGTQD